ncbi:MAG: hypothetical protein HPY84_13900 [Syntrophobacteraceae bacterium]|jgi:orotate phosphoribosyltransferase|nr:hypothetical protein [Syntrophobacteraceae bacterium]
MCFAIDKVHDREKTRKQIRTPLAPKHGRNWLGHREKTQAAMIDYMLITGASIGEMARMVRASKARVRNHLYHLEDEHGLTFTVEGDRRRFADDLR